ncbi:MAG: Rrf2 family transcriptional regulator [Candidatus Dasytiphilus stammeri]
MKLTSKGYYALTAILDVAMHSNKGQPVSLPQISQRQGISLAYLEQLFTRLRKTKLVSSVRGPGGGYLLGKKVHEITVSSVMMSVEEVLDATKCHGKKNCHNGQQCFTHKLWTDLSTIVNNFLTKMTLAELINPNSRIIQ